MHAYLKSIGFGKLKRESEAEKLLDEIYRDYTVKSVVKTEEGAYLELSKEFAPDMGITLCGILDNDGFHRLNYYPYFHGNGVSITEELSIEKRVNGESYSGFCEDGRVGISIIFFIQNSAEFQKEQILDHFFGKKVTTTLSGLANNGMILLPVTKNTEKAEENKRNWMKRNQLMSAAKNGDPEAIESLTVDDMDLYSMVSRRVDHEDIYTIVDTYFMPYGVECDQYQLMGNILFYTKVVNSVTKEAVYQMTIECNDIVFDICINAADLMGDPEVGRRFKGNIWLQGRLNFE